MDLTTKYLGLTLKNPIIASSSPLTTEIANFKALEDAGAGAIVMHSLFEEQLTREALALEYDLAAGTESFAEAVTYFPHVGDYEVGPEEYLNNIIRAKKTTTIPIIGSLNGRTSGGWLNHAKRIEEAGADALELNIYYLPTDPKVSSVEVEQSCVDIVASVKGKVKIPVAVKLSPYFSAMSEMAMRFEKAGVDGLVLFNRFYQPDFNLDTMEASPKLNLSSRQELRLPLRWIAILRGQTKASLAGVTGIHEAYDVIKMVLAGADATMMCSALLMRGIGHISTVVKDLEAWMANNEYASISEMKGILSLKACASPEAFERANYVKTLQSYR